MKISNFFFFFKKKDYFQPGTMAQLIVLAIQVLVSHIGYWCLRQKLRILCHDACNNMKVFLIYFYLKKGLDLDIFSFQILFIFVTIFPDVDLSG